jgi:hypothetical protein
MRIKNKVYIFSASLVVLTTLIFVYYKITDGFSLKIVQEAKSFSMEKNDNLNEVNKILDQPFRYLARGRQSFVFVSDDDKYVIKFLNSRRYDVSLLKHNFIKSKYIKKHYEKRITRFSEDIKALDLACKDFKDEAALIFVHPFKTHCFKNNFVFYDKLNRKNEIDLNEVVFILQKKACDVFYTAFEKADDELKNHYILGYLNVIEKRARALVIDSDLDRKYSNYAVVKDKVITIDIGRTYFDEKLKDPYFFNKEIIRSTKTLRRYLAKNHPEKMDLLLNKTDEIMKNFENDYLDKKYFSNHLDAKTATSSNDLSSSNR